MGTKIAWTDETWNPVTGCSPVSEGCARCYAESIAKRFWGERKFSDVRFHEDRLKEPLSWRKPRMVFVNSMSDLFHPKVKGEWQARIGAVMYICRTKNKGHTFQILTKHPGAAAEYYNDYVGVAYYQNAPNIWLGVTAENQEWADKRIPVLLQIPAAVRFVSFEPLLSGVDMTPYLPCTWNGIGTCPRCGWEQGGIYPSVQDGHRPGIDWAIIGCESGPKRRPCETQWVADIFEQCVAADVRRFIKQINIDGEVVHDADRIALELSDYVGRPLCVEDIRQFPKEGQ